MKGEVAMIAAFLSGIFVGCSLMILVVALFYMS